MEVCLVWPCAHDHQQGAATNPDAHVFAYAAAQTKKVKLGKGSGQAGWMARSLVDALVD